MCAVLRVDACRCVLMRTDALVDDACLCVLMCVDARFRVLLCVYACLCVVVDGLMGWRADWWRLLVSRRIAALMLRCVDGLMR